MTARQKNLSSVLSASPKFEPLKSSVTGAPRASVSEISFHESYFRARLRGLRIVLIASEPSLSRVEVTFSSFGCPRLKTAQDCIQGYAVALEEACDAVLIELSLAREGGWKLLRQLRACRPNLTILVVTPENCATKLIAGALYAGADDVIDVRVERRELCMRVTGIMDRRSARSECSAPRHPFSLDVETRQIRYGGQAIELSRTQFLIFEALISNIDRVISYAELGKLIGGRRSTRSRAIHVHLHHIRKRFFAFRGIDLIVKAKRNRGFVASVQVNTLNEQDSKGVSALIVNESRIMR